MTRRILALAAVAVSQFVAQPVAALEQKIFNLPQRQGKTDIHHHCEADNLG